MSSTLKEWLKHTIAELEEERVATPGTVNEDAANALAAMKLALASLEAEPVAVTDDMAYAFHHALSDSSLGADEVEEIKAGLRAAFANVTAPPVPVSVPDELYQQLSELYHAQEKRLFKIAQRIKGQSFDKYAYSPSQAIDVLESAIFGERDEESCRAAMLQGAENADSLPGIKPAPALDSLAKNAESLPGNSPVIQDGWVMVPVEPTHEMLEAGDEQFGTYDVYRRMIAAAPQQEVK